MEELEFDELIDAVFHLGECARGAAGKHIDRCRGKDLLEPPDRRNCRDEIADMIDLHHQDAPDVAVPEQRVAGE